MNNAKQIQEVIAQYSDLEIFNSSEIYNSQIKEASVDNYYKVLSRLEKKGDIYRITKGLYCIPRKSEFGIIEYSNDKLYNYFMGNNNDKGMFTGYKLFNKYNLTTQMSKNINILSNVVTSETKTIKNLNLKKVNIQFDSKTKLMLEFLEIIDNYKEIEDLNRGNLLSYLKKTINKYDGKVMNDILKRIKYKKSTIASIETILNFFEIHNDLKKYLNKVSKYKTIDMEGLNESTS